MSTDKPDCSRHSKQVGGFTDMKLLAEAVGDLNYETLKDFLEKFSRKLFIDAAKDRAESRTRLANYLDAAANNIHFAASQIGAAWDVCKPFMEKPNT